MVEGIFYLKFHEEVNGFMKNGLIKTVILSCFLILVLSGCGHGEYSNIALPGLGDLPAPKELPAGSDPLKMMEKVPLWNNRAM